MDISKPRGGTRRRRLLQAGIGATLAAATLLSPMMGLSVAAQDGSDNGDPPGYKVIADGLNNPRGITFGPAGKLYVAEAGTGGDDCIEAPPLPGEEPDPSEEPFFLCFGQTGAITKVWPGGKEQVVSGLASYANEVDEGNFATGPHDVSFHGNKGYFVTGLFAPPEARELPGVPDFADEFAYLFRFDKDGDVHRVADLGEYEAEENPDGGELETNPHSVYAAGNYQLVVDASGNDLLKVDKNGDISTIAVFPARPVDAPPFIPPEELPPDGMFPMQAVPTSVVTGPDGAYYVGQLTGFPFPEGGANVYRIEHGEDPEVYASGFSNIMDIAFMEDGSLLVVEFYHGSLLEAEEAVFAPDADPATLLRGTGRLIRVYPNGARETVSDDLTTPGGVAVGEDGYLYVTNYSGFAGLGEVVRIDPLVGGGRCPVSIGEISREQWEMRGYNIISGTDEDDEIWGTTGKDLVFGLGGNDTIYGMAGDDVISGGDGKDTVYAGAGNDIVCGNDGQDRLHGGDGWDELYGGQDKDWLFGNEDNDSLWGDDAGDGLVGGMHNDVLHGGYGNDFLNGDEGKDVLSGGPGNDTLKGKEGNDWLIGGSGQNQCDGGSGDKKVVDCN